MKEKTINQRRHFKPSLHEKCIRKKQRPQVVKRNDVNKQGRYNNGGNYEKFGISYSLNFLSKQVIIFVFKNNYENL